MAEFYLGLMSGTSMDGVDVALVDFSQQHPHLLDCQTFPYPSELLGVLHGLCASKPDEIDTMGRADRAVAQFFAQASLALLEANYLQPHQVRAIGSHGQTIRHRPNHAHSFSLQIGDPNTIAALTGIDVIADFRRKDIALGGQGAPLVPAFHHAIFAHPSKHRVIVNIGGIANITYLPANDINGVIGFDTGPGNTLMDAWCNRHINQSYDQKGQWAAQGRVDGPLLTQLLSHPYLAEPAPKSTGRELFNLSWFESQLQALSSVPSAQNCQTTLASFTARSIVQHIQQLAQVDEVYICGGGAQNEFLLEELESELHECELLITDSLGVHADAVEAMAFAWLAYAHNNRIPGNVPNVTGASKAAVLGSFTPAG